MKKLFYLSAMALCFLLSSNLDAQTREHDFNDGKFGPFQPGKPEQNGRVKVTKKRIITTWDQNNYDGTNSGRKSQFNLKTNLSWTKELWVGFDILIDKNYMKSNKNTEAALMQIWGINPDDTGNHYAMIKFDGNNGGAMTWQHRYNSSKKEKDYLIMDNFPRNKYVSVIVRIKLAKKDKGTVQVWIDGVKKLNKFNQTIGWGTQNDNGQTAGYTSNSPAFGQYNFLEKAATAQTYYDSKHDFDGHKNGEKRTVSYDNVTIYKGSNGYDRVDPDNTSNKSVNNKEELSNTSLDNNFSAYPNPVENELTIKLNDNSTEETSIELYAINGQKVIETKASGESVNLDVSKLNSGIYVLKINSKTQSLTKRLVKL